MIGLILQFNNRIRFKIFNHLLKIASEFFFHLLWFYNYFFPKLYGFSKKIEQIQIAFTSVLHIYCTTTIFIDINFGNPYFGYFYLSIQICQ